MNVLLIEDRLEDAILIEKQLGREADAACIEVSVRRADTLGAGIEMASQDGIDCVLLDLGLPDGRGLNNLRRLHQVNPDLPVVILSGVDDERTAASAVRAGAHAYLVKRPMDQAEAVLPVLREAISAKAAPVREDTPSIRSEGRFRLDSECQITSWDDQCVALLKWTPEQVIGQPFQELAPARRQEELSSILRHASKLSGPVKVHLLLPGGKTRFMEIQPHGERGDDGGRTWAIADAEESRRAHQAMQVLGVIMSATRDAVISQDLDGQIHSCSRSTTEFVGREVESIAGTNFVDLFPPEDAGAAQTILGAIRRGRVLRDVDAQFKHASGRRVPVRMTLAPMRDELGGLIGACIIARPVYEDAGSGASWRRERTMLEERAHLLQEENGALRDELRALRRSGATG